MKTLIAVLITAGLFGCGQQDAPKSVTAPDVQQSPAPVVIPDHYYVMQDGMKYGYPAAISEDAQKAGQRAEQLVMALYAGEKNGKHQVHLIDGVTVTAMECESPCRYIKAMSYIDNPYLKGQIKVEHIATAPDSLGYQIMQDAIRGKLKQYGVGNDKKRYNVWVDERKGMQRTPIPKA